MSKLLRSGLRRSVCAVALALAGCSANLPAAPTEPSHDPAFEAAQAPARPGLDEEPEDGPEALQPGDVVAVRMVGDQTQDSRSTPIDRGGYVHLALLGTVRVAGVPLAEAEGKLQKALERVDRFSRVSLELVDARGRQATVVGAVERPGVVPLVGGPRLAAVLAATGGVKSATVDERLTSLGDLDGVRVVRQGQVLPVDARLALEGDARHNVRVRPGDQIYVPPSTASRVVVLGDVGRARTMAFRPGMRLTEALADAGGMTRQADAADVRVVRGGYAAPRVYVASPKALFAGKAPDILLAPGDVVYVTEHWLATAGQVLERLVPALATGLLLHSAVSR